MEINEYERRALICSEQYNGILPYSEAFYIYSIIYSSTRCLGAFERYKWIKKRGATAEELVSSVQEAISHAASLSRYFWPSKQGTRKQPNLNRLKELRGIMLRKAFKIEDTSGLHNRELRNVWEHFDERLDIYCLENDSGYFYPGCMVGHHTLADKSTNRIFKLLDVDAECLVLLGKKYFFSPIRDAVQLVLNRAKEFESNGLRLK
ncbi:hypothetical protein [Prosthecochloris sp.]|uniref:hypothetical protein n=1 Tax=Prosthecochloris sp. TaxID=290513 RepID=UPI00257F57F5|nr:hypothetical protein [Prosthecochloris sp.]